MSTGPNGSARGRPSKLTDETRAKILYAMQAGASKGSAAEYAGIGESTLHRWLTDDRPAYRRFRADLEIVEATVGVIVVANLFRLTARSTRACIAWLEVRGGPEWQPVCRECGKRLRRKDRGHVPHDLDADPTGSDPSSRSADDPSGTPSSGRSPTISRLAEIETSDLLEEVARRYARDRSVPGDFGLHTTDQ